MKVNRPVSLLAAASLVISFPLLDVVGKDSPMRLAPRSEDVKPALRVRQDPLDPTGALPSPTISFTDPTDLPSDPTDDPDSIDGGDPGAATTDASAQPTDIPDDGSGGDSGDSGNGVGDTVETVTLVVTLTLDAAAATTDLGGAATTAFADSPDAAATTVDLGDPAAETDLPDGSDGDVPDAAATSFDLGSPAAATTIAGSPDAAATTVDLGDPASETGLPDGSGGDGGDGGDGSDGGSAPAALTTDTATPTAWTLGLLGTGTGLPSLPSTALDPTVSVTLQKVPSWQKEMMET